MKLAWYMLKGFVIGVLTAPIVALLHVYDMAYTFPREVLNCEKRRPTHEQKDVCS